MKELFFFFFDTHEGFFPHSKVYHDAKWGFHRRVSNLQLPGAFALGTTKPSCGKFKVISDHEKLI